MEWFGSGVDGGGVDSFLITSTSQEKKEVKKWPFCDSVKENPCWCQFVSDLIRSVNYVGHTYRRTELGFNFLSG